MWIRSQNGTILIYVDEIHINNAEDSKEIWTGITERSFLGRYETPERAMEVLDDIQNKMIDGYTDYFVYQMPEK